MDVTLPALKPTVIYFNRSDTSRTIAEDQQCLKDIFGVKGVLLFDFPKEGRLSMGSNESHRKWSKRYSDHICDKIKLIYEVQSPSTRCNMILVTHGKATAIVKLMLKELKAYRECFTVLNLGGPLLVPNELGRKVVNYIPPDSAIHEAYSRCVQVALLVKKGEFLEVAVQKAHPKNAKRFVERYNRYTIVILSRDSDRERPLRSVRLNEILTNAVKTLERP